MHKNLRDTIKDAEKHGVAIGHFNISNLEQLKAIAHVAQKLDVPAIIGVSEGERDYLGVHHVKDLVDSYNKEHGGKVNAVTGGHFWLFLNADHTHSIDAIKKAAGAGFDAVIFDGGKLPTDENIKLTQEAITCAKKLNPEIIVEGELGNIGTSSEIRKEIPKGVAIRPEDLTTPEDAARFVRETGVDLLAPAVGNVHGMLARQSLQSDGGFASEGYDYPLNIERIRAIRKAAGVPLVLHGGSGNTDAEFSAAIDAGVAIIHISTELRVAWRKGIEESFKEFPEEIAPYKLVPHAMEDMERVIEQRLKLFNKKID